MRIYPPDKMDRLYRAALRVLRETGFRIDHPGLLEKFEQRGMKVDYPARRVAFTEDLIKELLAPAPNYDKPSPQARFWPLTFHPGGSYPKYFDWAQRRSYPGSSALLLELVRVFNRLEDVSVVPRFLTLTDVPPAVEPIVATGLVIKHSPRPGRGGVYRPDNLPYLLELGEIATGRPACTDFIPNCTCIVPPLKMTHEEAALLIARSELGIKINAASMPSSGATAPITREGTVVIELAEIMAIWLCARLINPAVPLVGTCASSSFDMRAATCVFASPEAVLQDCAADQILRAYFDADVCVASSYVEAKVPGIQTCYEKLFKFWWTFHFTGEAGFDIGLLEAAQTFCAAQALLDMEIFRSCAALFRPAPPAGVDVPFAEIHDVVTRDSTFLDCPHTLQLFRTDLYYPELLDRSARRSDAEELTQADGLLDRAQARYEELRDHAPQYVAPPEMCRAVDDVVARATRALA